ncbi:MAG: NB-ARC domain-containing protein, partial [Chitinophagales bacterium]
MSTFNTNKIEVTGDGNITIQDVKDSTIHLHVNDETGLKDFLKTADKELVKELWEKVSQHKSTTFDHCKNVIHGIIQARDIHIGDVTHNHFYSETKLPKALSSQIPTLTQDKIVGRKAELADLQQRLFNHHQVLLVNGLGGIGKTTLAQVYVGEHWETYQHIVWVSQLSEDFKNDLVNTEGLLLNLGIQSEGKEVETLFLEILTKLKEANKQPNLM